MEVLYLPAAFFTDDPAAAGQAPAAHTRRHKGYCTGHSTCASEALAIGSGEKLAYSASTGCPKSSFIVAFTCSHQERAQSKLPRGRPCSAGLAAQHWRHSPTERLPLSSAAAGTHSSGTHRKAMNNQRASAHLPQRGHRALVKHVPPHGLHILRRQHVVLWCTQPAHAGPFCQVCPEEAWRRRAPCSSVASAPSGSERGRQRRGPAYQHGNVLPQFDVDAPCSSGAGRELELIQGSDSSARDSPLPHTLIHARKGTPPWRLVLQPHRWRSRRPSGGWRRVGGTRAWPAPAPHPPAHAATTCSLQGQRRLQVQ